jgi:hypothetical protein
MRRRRGGVARDDGIERFERSVGVAKGPQRPGAGGEAGWAAWVEPDRLVCKGERFDGPGLVDERLGAVSEGLLFGLVSQQAGERQGGALSGSAADETRADEA